MILCSVIYYYSLIQAYSLFWTLLALILSCTAYIFIPLLLKKRQPTNHHIEDHLLQRTKPLRGYLVLCAALLILAVTYVIMSEKNARKQRSIPAVNYVFMVAFVFLLLIILRQNDAKIVVRQYLFSLFEIQENPCEDSARAARNTAGPLIQSCAKTVVSVESNISQGTCITVAPFAFELLEA